jgi:predicted HAD superfamily Cof-like phosphohydrolase
VSEVNRRVREFMGAMGQQVRPSPELPTIEQRMLAVRLIAEELLELAEAYGVRLVAISRGREGPRYMHALPQEIGDPPDLVAAAKELTDLEYVVTWAFCSAGLPQRELGEAVHASNMTKLDDEGRPVHDQHGKVVKGPNYRPPDIRAIVLGSQPTQIGD